MYNLIQFLVFWILVPIIYICIVLFDAIIIIRARTLQQRWRGLAGVLAGFLVGIIIILLDQNYGPLITNASQGNNLEIAWTSAVIFSVIGFAILLGIDFLLSRGVIPFVVMFTIAGVMLSAYFLVNLSAIRVTTAITTMGFLVGVILYFMIFPTRIFNALRSRGEEQTES